MPFAIACIAASILAIGAAYIVLYAIHCIDTYFSARAARIEYEAAMKLFEYYKSKGLYKKTKDED